MRRIQTVQHQRGIVLIVALALLSLLLLLAAGAQVHRRAERARAAALLNRDLAQRHALEALDDALAALQGTAGHDQCATGSAALLPFAAQPHWTLAQRPDAQPVLLVTGLPTNDRVTADALLVGAGTAGADVANHVHAPSRIIAGADGRPVGRLAWWVADQGIKLPVQPADGRDAATLFPGELPSMDPGSAWAQLRQQVPGPPPLPQALQALRDQPGAALSLAGLQFAAGQQPDGAHFHTHAASAWFTIVNPLDGGLKEDLGTLADPGVTPATFRHPPPPAFADWMRMTAPPALPTPVRGPVQPVVAEFVLVCGIAADNIGRKPYASATQLPVIFNYYTYTDLWNPWTRALAMGADSPDIRVAITGLPRITLPGGTATLPDPLLVDLDAYEDMPPGQVQWLSSPKTEGGTSNTGVWQPQVGTVALLKDDAPLTLQAAAHTVHIAFYDLGEPDAPPFFEIDLADYEGFTVQYGSGQNFGRPSTTDSYYGMGRTALDDANWSFAYHFKLRDGFDANTQALCQWMRDADPRERQRSFHAPSGGDSLFQILAKPRDYDRYGLEHPGDPTSGVMRPDDFFVSRYAKGGPWIDRLATVFDLPAHPPMSINGLRDAPAAGLGSHSMGAGRDDGDHALDRYFVSTLPDGTWDGTAPLPNFRLRLADPDAPATRSPADAAGLLQVGLFNVNTASEEAWTAVLRSLAVPGYEFDTPSGERRTVDLRAPVFTLGTGAALPQSDEATDILATSEIGGLEGLKRTPGYWRTHPAFLVGVRDLDGVDQDGESALNSLARAIANGIRERGRPFTSLTDFARSQVIQDAIDSVPAINLRANGLDAIPQGSPGSVTQAALLSALAPMLTTRSDTFLVRCKGEALDASGNVRAQAWLEALVQRMPDPGETERPFRIVYQRWLDAGEL